MRTRDVLIDVLKGIGILFMLSAHSLGGYVHSFAYSFHMPLFFIVSGYFYRSKGLKCCISDGFNRLLAPSLYTCLLMLVISIVEDFCGLEGVKSPSQVMDMLVYANGSSANYTKIWGNFACIGSLWFLGCLFWAKIIYEILHYLADFRHIALLCFFLSVIAVIIGQYMVLPYSFLQGITVLPFLCIGECIKKVDTKQLKTEYFVFFFLLVVGWLFSTFYDVLNIAAFKWKWFVIPNILFASAGVGVMYYLSRFIAKKPFVSKILAFIGEYSILFVCFPVIESYFIPLKQIVPSTSYQMAVILMLKTLWAVMAVAIVVNSRILRSIYGVAKPTFLK